MRLSPYAKYDVQCTVYHTSNIVPNFPKISQELWKLGVENHVWPEAFTAWILIKS